MHQLFDNLQFRVLRERLFATLTAPEPEASEGFEVDVQRLGPDEVAGFLAEHAGDGRRVGVSFGGTWGRGTGTLNSVTLAGADGTAGWIDVAELTAADDKALAGWLADADVPKACHDVKGPLLALAEHGWRLAGVSSDTQLAAYLVQPGQRTFDLADLALRYLKRELREESDPASGQLTLDGGLEESDDARAQVEAVRASAIRDLADALDAELADRGGTALLTELELPLTFVLADIEAHRHRRRRRAPHRAAVRARRRGARGRVRGARGGRPPVQPRLAQAAAADPVRRAGPAQDQAHQDRLHHRRRRPGLAGRGQRQPAARPSCCATARSPG